MIIFGKQLNWRKVIGDPNYFTLQERIFNAVSIIAFIAMCFEVPFNFAVGLPVPAFLCIFGVFFAAFLYYISRFKRKSGLGVLLFCIVCNIVFSINYFYNSGVFGPNLLLFCLAFFMILAIIPKEHYKVWMPINILLVLAILLIEYFNPQLVANTYQNEASKFIDFFVTYLVTVILTYFTISYLRENYDIEKFKVVQKNIAIEEQNVRILAQKQELEVLNAEKDKLFSIIAHDIKWPLHSIQSYLEILNEANLTEKEKQEVEQQLLQITRDTSDLLMNMLSWSKSQMKGALIDLGIVNVGASLSRNLTIAKTLATKKEISLLSETDEALNIIADPNMFELIIRNLVNNAIKFTPKGGLVRVVAKKEVDQCLIMVSDNGLGIKSEQQEKLFKLKASSTYGTNNEKGIGLGLLLCKEFTDLQNGKIWFESEVGVGSTFYLLFQLGEC